MADSTTLAVLHAVRLGSVIGSGAVAERTGLDPRTVDVLLRSCEHRSWVRRSEGRLTGWSLTRTGRDEGERLLASELDAAGARSQVDAAHRAFVPLNARVLQVCTDWQVVRRPDGVEVPNDHSDEAHDLAVLQRLGRLHSETRPLLRRLAANLDRFGSYEQRLTRALEHTLAGRTEWFTRPTIESFHTVWFELHEDLLATLGLQRVDEHDDTAVDTAPSRTPLLEEHR